MEYVIKRADELYHSDEYVGEDYSDGICHWKYIDKKKVNGKWRYIYKLEKGGYDLGKNLHEKTLSLKNTETGSGVTAATGTKGAKSYVSISKSGGKGKGFTWDYQKVEKKIGNFTVTGKYNKKVKYFSMKISYTNPKIKKATSKGKNFINKLFG